MLLVDDSIVRGTTSEQIVSMARSKGAKKIYFASAIAQKFVTRMCNVALICQQNKNSLLMANVDEIKKLIGVDKLVFQDP